MNAAWAKWEVMEEWGERSQEPEVRSQKSRERIPAAHAPRTDSDVRARF